MSYTTLPEAHDAVKALQDETSGSSDTFQTLTEFHGRMRNVYDFVANTLHPMLNTEASGVMLGQANEAADSLQQAMTQLLVANANVAELAESMGGYRL